MHRPAPAGDHAFAGQAVQTAGLVAPAPGEYVPAAQAVQALEALEAAYVPAMQDAQALDALEDE